tara:strand:+ start:252 stop:509 length:258 start_codon:yes stop_codon:yes gene_type:complete
MKIKLSKKEAQEKIDFFFKQPDFTPKAVKKIKRLAMKFNIKLKAKRKLFCKKCLSKLKGKVKITKHYKTVECKSCNYKNKWKINP